jgi:hypothetical protein
MLGSAIPLQDTGLSTAVSISMPFLLKPNVTETEGGSNESQRLNASVDLCETVKLTPAFGLSVFHQILFSVNKV